MPTTGGKVFVARISDAIATSLEQRILEGTLKAGDRLQPERELAVELGVSRPSLREAIQKLVSKGLLQSRQGGGTFVTDRIQAMLFDPWRDLLSTHPTAHEDLLDLRRLVEGRAAEWAAERATVADQDRIAAAFAALDGDADGEERVQQTGHDIAFHQAVAEASHNVLVGHLMRTMLRLMEGDILLNLTEMAGAPRAAELLRAQHVALFEAIRERKPAAARQAAETHIDFVRATLAQSLRSAARREVSERHGDFTVAN